MIEKIGKVSNPLTVIAIFAGIAEVAGTITLPFVSPALQSLFIWYVMGLPFLIIIIFFAILILKPTVLYAPSDYNNDDSFFTALRIHKKVEIIKENIEKLPEDNELKQNYMDIIQKLEDSNKMMYFDNLNNIENYRKNRKGQLEKIILYLLREEESYTIEDISSFLETDFNITKKTLDKLVKMNYVNNYYDTSREKTIYRRTGK